MEINNFLIFFRERVLLGKWNKNMVYENVTLEKRVYNMHRNTKPIILAAFIAIACFVQNSDSATQIDAPPEIDNGMSSEHGKNSVTYQLMNNKYINLSTGLPYYSIPLVRLWSQSKQYYYDLNISYKGDENKINWQNEFADITGVGYGWNLGTSYILINPKGTREMWDDSYYFVFSDGTITELTCTNIPSGSCGYQCEPQTRFFKFKSNPTWTIEGTFSPYGLTPPDKYIDDTYYKPKTYGFTKFVLSRNDGLSYEYSTTLTIPVQNRSVDYDPAIKDPCRFIALDLQGVNATFTYMVALSSVSEEKSLLVPGPNVCSFEYKNDICRGKYKGYRHQVDREYDKKSDISFAYDRSILLSKINLGGNDYVALNIEPMGVNEGSSNEYMNQFLAEIPDPFRFHATNYVQSIDIFDSYYKNRDKISFTYSTQGEIPLP